MLPRWLKGQICTAGWAYSGISYSTSKSNQHTSIYPHRCAFNSENAHVEDETTSCEGAENQLSFHCADSEKRTVHSAAGIEIARRAHTSTRRHMSQEIKTNARTTSFPTHHKADHHSHYNYKAAEILFYVPEDHQVAYLYANT
jgi:hypothetical protein